MITAIVNVNAAVDRIPEVAQAIADLDGVTEVYSVAGDVDLVALVRVRRHEELADVIAGRLNKVQGVLSTQTLIAFQAYSRHDLEATFSLGIEPEPSAPLGAVAGTGDQRERAVMRVVVAGAGVAGVAAAGLLAREGHEVVLVDPDPGVPAQPGPDEVFDDWVRPGVGQFHQPHNFLGRGRRVLLDAFPAAHAALMATGAGEIDMTSFLGDAPREPGDEDLTTITCRRPVFDAALRSAALGGVTCRPGDVAAVVATDGTVEGVVLVDGEELRADLVVDAAGRGPHAARWLSAAELEPWPEEASDSRLLYYSRHFRVGDGGMPPFASVLGGPRGDVGYLAYATFLGDNRTFCVCVMVPPDEPAWRQLRDPDAFTRVAAQLPGVQPWLDASEPVTGVLPMGALRNTLRHPLDGERVRTPGLVAIGDARSHTNPTFAFGASMSLWHAGELAAAAGAAADPSDLALRFEQRVGTDTAERFRAVAAEDDQRRRAWSGEPIDLTDREQAPEMYLRNVVYRTAPGDPELFRAVARRMNGLDPIDALLQRTDLLDKAQSRYDERRADFPEPPPKEDVLRALAG